MMPALRHLIEAAARIRHDTRLPWATRKKRKQL